jgi:hypothetical protein
MNIIASWVIDLHEGSLIPGHELCASGNSSYSNLALARLGKKS